MSDKYIFFREKQTGATLGGTGEKSATPAGFEAVLGAGMLNRVFQCQVKTKVEFNAAVTGGEFAVDIYAGDALIHTVSFGAGASVQAKTEQVDVSKFGSGVKVSARLRVVTALVGATDVEADIQLLLEKPFILDACG